MSQLLDQSNIAFQRVTLGEAQLSKPLSETQLKRLSQDLQEIEFELLESKTISHIKTLIINQIHHSAKTLKVNYSDFLASELHTDYSALSKLFSSVEGITIEKFITAQKIEKAKELLFYGELT